MKKMQLIDYCKDTLQRGLAKITVFNSAIGKTKNYGYFLYSIKNIAFE